MLIRGCTSSPQGPDPDNISLRRLGLPVPNQSAEQIHILLNDEHPGLSPG